jgi:hypothetical protein
VIGRPVAAAANATGIPQRFGLVADPEAIGNFASMAIPGAGEVGAARELSGAAKAAGVGEEALAANRTAARALPKANTLKVVTQSQPKITDAHSEDIRFLHGEGIRMTPGQIQGGIEREVESKRASDPYRGGGISQGIRQSVEDFDRAMYRRSLNLIGENYPTDGPVGPPAVDHMFNVADQRYDAIKPKIKLQATPELEDDFKGALDDIGPAASVERADLEYIINTRVKPSFTNGTMDGQTFKDLESYLTGEARALHERGSAYQLREASAIDRVVASLRDNMETHSDPTVRADVAKLNSYYASINRIADATYQAKASNGVFTPAQALTTAGKGGPKARRMVARGNAFNQDLMAAAQRVLPDKIKDSGTAGRSLLNKGIGAGLGASAGAGLGHAVAGSIGAELGTAAGAYLGSNLDVAVAPTTNALARMMLNRSAAKQLAKRGIAVQPRNYLKAAEQRSLASKVPMVAGPTQQIGPQQ